MKNNFNVLNYDRQLLMEDMCYNKWYEQGRIGE